MKILITRDSVSQIPSDEEILYGDYLDLYVNDVDYEKLAKKSQFNSVLDEYNKDIIIVHSLGVEKEKGIFSKKKEFGMIEIQDISFSDL